MPFLETVQSALLALLLLHIFSARAMAAAECSPAVTRIVGAALDDSYTLFRRCLSPRAGARVQINSLFDVVKLPAQDFLRYCRPSSCTAPVQSLLPTIPTACLISYHGSPRNLSKELSAITTKCIEATRAAEQTDEDYMDKYFLD
jgi:hypothetical protein